MGFFTGRVTYLRFRVDGLAPKAFGPEHLERLVAHAVGKQQAASKDSTEVGWIAGDDILDVGFDLAKNVVNDMLHFALRVDTQKLPGDLLRAYPIIRWHGLVRLIARRALRRGIGDGAARRLPANTRGGRVPRRLAEHAAKLGA
jgi:hypothetical protein